MKPALIMGYLLLLVLAVISACSDSGKINKLETQIQEQQMQITGLQSDVQQRDSQIISLKSDLAKARDEKNTLDSQLVQVQTEVEKLKATSTTNISTLTTQVGQLQAENAILNIQVASLTKQLTPSPDHAMTWDQVLSDLDLRSIAWAGNNYGFQAEVELIGRLYNSTHVYIPNETDCNDMAVDIWNMSLKDGIKSVIVIGNLGKSALTFADCNHAWLTVFNAEGNYMILEPTNGEVIYGTNAYGAHNSQIDPYLTGLPYKKPSDLRSDILKRW